MDLMKLAKSVSDEDKKDKQNRLLTHALIASGVLTGIAESQAVRDRGPSVLISPEALIGGLGGGAIGGLGTYGVSRMLGGKHPVRDALSGAAVGAMLGHAGGAFGNSLQLGK